MRTVHVDGSCRGNPGKAEYQGKLELEGKYFDLFRSEVYPIGTNNLMEFLAIAQAMMHTVNVKGQVTITSDSQVAISWIKRKSVSTSLEKSDVTARLFEDVEKSIKFLKTSDLSKYKVIKWETKKLGQSPADFGRK